MEKPPTSSLSPSILARLKAPLTPGEQLWLMSLPMSLKLSAEEEKLLVRLSLEELAAAAPALKQRCEPFIDFEEDPNLLGEQVVNSRAPSPSCPFPGGHG